MQISSGGSSAVSRNSLLLKVDSMANIAVATWTLELALLAEKRKKTSQARKKDVVIQLPP